MKFENFRAALWRHLSVCCDWEAASVAVVGIHTLSQPWLCSRGGLPNLLFLNGHIIGYAFFAVRFALTFIAVLARFSTAH